MVAAAVMAEERVAGTNAVELAIVAIEVAVAVLVDDAAKMPAPLFPPPPPILLFGGDIPNPPLLMPPIGKPRDDADAAPMALLLENDDEDDNDDAMPPPLENDAPAADRLAPAAAANPRPTSTVPRHN